MRTLTKYFIRNKETDYFLNYSPKFGYYETDLKNSIELCVDYSFDLSQSRIIGYLNICSTSEFNMIPKEVIAKYETIS